LSRLSGGGFTILRKDDSGEPEAIFVARKARSVELDQQLNEWHAIQ